MDRMQSGSWPYLYDCTSSLNMGLIAQLSYENGCYDTSHCIDTHCLVLEELNQKLLHSRTCIVSIENAKYVFPGPTQPSVACMCHENQIVAAKAMSIKSE